MPPFLRHTLPMKLTDPPAAIVRFNTPKVLEVPRRPVAQAHRLLVLAAALASALPIQLDAQTVTPTAPPAGGQSAPAIAVTPAAFSADAEWAALKNAVRQNRLTPAAPASGGKSLPLSSAQQAARHLDEANQLRDFRARYPLHPAAKESKQLEAVALAFAALKGDTSQDLRRTGLVDELRGDPKLPATQRYEAVAWSKQVALARQKPATKAALLAAHESIGRDLVREFPAVSTGYASLLGVARDSDPTRGRALAQDLQGMSGAPPALRAEATELLVRLDLIGKPLAPLFTGTGAAVPATRTGAKVIVLYTWAGNHKASLVLAGRLAQGAPGWVQFVGICLDQDTARARQTAEQEKLPGTHYYEAQGSAGALARALHMQHPSMVFLVDAGGVIRDVRGDNGFLQRIAPFGP